MDYILSLCYSCHVATAARPTAERPLRKDAERNRQRILDAAAELFMERGLAVTLNDIAHHADVGVGTVYRRFPDKEQLIDALFEDRLLEFVVLAEESLAEPDPWEGFVRFLEKGFELQARDKGLKQLLFATPQGCARVDGVRDRVLPLVEALVERAHKDGALREDVMAGDIPVIQWMLGAIVDHAGSLSPELWRRYLELILGALRADRAPAAPLGVAPLDRGQLDRVLESEAFRAGGARAARPR
jgi:AcrR family transcriptional regulator